MYLLCQPAEYYQKAVDIATRDLVIEAVDQMMMIRKRKQVATESPREETEQRHSLDTVLTPTSALPAPLSTSTPADLYV